LDSSHIKELLTGFVDKELSPEDTQTVNDHLIRCGSCRTEYEKLLATAKQLDSISFEEPEDRILATIWRKPYSRFQKRSGLVMVIGGYVSLGLFAIYEYLMDGSVAVIPKIAAFSILVGFVVLLGAVIRGRVKTYKVDKYKEVIR